MYLSVEYAVSLSSYCTEPLCSWRVGEVNRSQGWRERYGGGEEGGRGEGEGRAGGDRPLVWCLRYAKQPIKNQRAL